MTKINEIYKCAVCGNIVEMVHAGAGTLVCCGEPMVLQNPNTVDASLEKHVPVVLNRPKADQPGAGTSNGYKIQIGSELHPMTAEHYIEWIEIVADGKIDRKYLQPGDEPIFEFCSEATEITARAYCNLHGLWGK